MVLDRQSRTLLLLAAFLVTGACASRDAEPLETSPAAVSLAADKLIVPIRVRANVPVVFARIDGAGPYPFIVDTGSAVTVLSQRVAEESGLECRPARLNLIGAEAAETRVVDIGHVGVLEIGRIRIESFDACVLDLGEIRSTVPGGVEGLLNLDLFGDHLVTIDYASRSLVLERGSLPAMDGGDVLDVRIDQGIPSLSTSIGDTPISVTVDTGSGEFLALPHATTDLLSFVHGPVDGSLSTTVTGRHRNRLGRLAADLVVGRHVVVRPIVSVTAREGRLGGAFLSRFRLTFDSAAARIRFVRDHPEPIEIRALRSAGIAFEIRPGGWRVFDVIPGTPTAAIGLEVGDLVVSIQGVPAREVDEASWRTLVASFEKIEIEVARDGGRQTMELPVFELVP